MTEWHLSKATLVLCEEVDNTLVASTEARRPVRTRCGDFDLPTRVDFGWSLKLDLPEVHIPVSEKEKTQA